MEPGACLILLTCTSSMPGYPGEVVGKAFLEYMEKIKIKQSEKKTRITIDSQERLSISTLRKD